MFLNLIKAYVKNASCIVYVYNDNTNSGVDTIKEWNSKIGVIMENMAMKISCLM